MSATDRTIRRDSGFTLVEMLAALVVTGLLVSGLMALTGDWLRGWRAGVVRTAETERLGAVLLRLSREIEGAVALSGDTAPSMIGTRTALAFVRESADRPAGGLDVVRFDAENDALLRAAHRYRDRGSFNELGARLPMPALSGALSFAYSADGKRWQEGWDSRRLPHAVRLSVERAAGDAQRSVHWVVLLAAAQPATCADVTSADLCDSLADAKPVERSLLDDNTPIRRTSRVRR